MKKKNLLLALLAGVTFIAGCNNNSTTSSSSVDNTPKNVWTGNVAAALEQVFGSSDVIPYLEAKDYVVEINTLQGTTINYVDIYCSTSSTTLINDYTAICEADNWTILGEYDDGYHYASKELSELITQVVGFAYYENTFNIFTYRDEIPDTSAYAAEWPENVRTVIDSTLGEGNPLPGILAETYTASTTNVLETYNAVDIHCSADRVEMDSEYATLLELAGYTLASETTSLNGLEYNVAAGRLTLSAYQYVFYTFTFEGTFNIISFVYETAKESDVFPSEFLNDCFSSVLTDAIPVLEGTYNYKYYVTSYDGYTFVVVEVASDTNPFTNYGEAFKNKGYTYDSESDLYYITTTEGHTIVAFFDYDAETKTGSIISYAQYGVKGTSTSFPANSFNAWLVQMVGLSFDDDTLLSFEATSYSYDVVANSQNGAYDFVITATVEEDPTDAYVAKIIELGFQYETTYGEYAAAIYADNEYYIFLWIKLSYADNTFTVTYSLSMQEI